MDVFKSIRSYLKVLGIYPVHFDQKYLDNVKPWAILFAFFLASVSSCIFLSCEAQTFDEYVDASNILINMISNGTILMTSILMAKQFLIFLANFDDVIQSSECDLIKTSN